MRKAPLGQHAPLLRNPREVRARCLRHVSPDGEGENRARCSMVAATSRASNVTIIRGTVCARNTHRISGG